MLYIISTGHVSFKSKEFTIVYLVAYETSYIVFQLFDTCTADLERLSQQYDKTNFTCISNWHVDDDDDELSELICCCDSQLISGYEDRSS